MHENTCKLSSSHPGVVAVKIQRNSKTALALRRASPPDPVRVQVQGGAPRRVFFQGVQMEIAASAGPWQTSGSWWDEHGWQAEEWDVVIQEPMQALRLRHEPKRKTWFVAGLYD